MSPTKNNNLVKCDNSEKKLTSIINFFTASGQEVKTSCVFSIKKGQLSKK